MTNKKTKNDKTIDDLNRDVLILQAERLAALSAKGKALAKELGYGDLEGLDAIHRYLIEKHHWLPRDVRALTIDELELLLGGDLM